MATPAPAIGIDLGTTFSCVALFRKGKVEVIANEHSNRTTPSYVAFTDSQRLIGVEAKQQAGLNPCNTVFGVKRLIGRQFNDQAVQHDMKQWPFKVVSDRGDPRIQVTYKGEQKQYSATEISSMILGKMKEIADTFVGQPVTKAVITVPAYFNDAQRQATKTAGEAAGLEVLRILNEPTAAGIAYGFDDMSGGKKKNILVFDLGGGTFDVSILTIENGVYEVRASSGDTHLGGEDFNSIMVDHFLPEIKKKLGKDISNNVKAMYRLRAACEEAKKSLTCNDNTSIDIDSLVDGQDFKSNLSRHRFDGLNIKLYDKIFQPLERALQDAKMSKNDINDIVLVGGSSRINGVLERLKKYLNGKELCKNINPDEAVAYGAAIQAAVLAGDKDPTLLKFKLNDVIPLSLGMEVVGGKMAIIINRNTKLPTTESQIFTTHFDNQPAISVVIYEGERELVEENNRLGEFVVTDIPPARREVPKIEVTFEVDTDGILNVSALQTRSGAKIKKKIDKIGVISHEEIQRMIEDAKQFKEDDEKERIRIDSMLALEDFCLEMQSKASYGKGLSPEELEKLERATEEILEWIRDNDSLDADEYTDKLNELHLGWDKKLARLQ